MAANDPNNMSSAERDLHAPAFRFLYGEHVDYARLVADLDDPEIYGVTTSKPDVQTYLDELSYIPQISSQEAAEALHEQALQPTADGMTARRQLLLGHLGLVVQVAIRYVKPNGPSMLECIDAGNVTLVELVDKVPGMSHTFLGLTLSRLSLAMEAVQNDSNRMEAGFSRGSLAGMGRVALDDMVVRDVAGSSEITTTFEYLMARTPEEQAQLIRRAARETLNHEQYLIFGAFYGISGFLRKSAADLAHGHQMSAEYMHGIIDDMSGKVRIALERLVATERVGAFLNSRNSLS